MRSRDAAITRQTVALKFFRFCGFINVTIGSSQRPEMESGIVLVDISSGSVSKIHDVEVFRAQAVNSQILIPNS